MRTETDVTLAEKIALLSGVDMWRTAGDARLGIAALKVTDGPNGARGDMASGASAACFPVGVAMGASFDLDLLAELGAALAVETKTKGAQVLLGPTINLQRTPLGGRHFECYAEDPYLTGVLACAFVGGLQAGGVGACPKHFVCNDSEFERHRVSSDVSERVLREVYLAPFEMVVRKAQPWTIMTAYNKINGTYAASHHRLLTEVLKGEWGFDGVALSDWGGATETVGNALGGLDLEMPGPARTFGAQLAKAIADGEVPEAVLDDKLTRLKLLSNRCAPSPDPVPERSVDLPEHRALARRAATGSMVLLKNTGIAPLDQTKIKTLAVIGPNATAGQIMGGGSSHVRPHYAVQPLAALTERLKDQVQLFHEPGCHIWRYVPGFKMAQLEAPEGLGTGFLREDFDTPDLSGPAGRRTLFKASQFASFEAFSAVGSGATGSTRLSARFTPDRDGPHLFGLASAGLSRLWIDGQLVIDNWTNWQRGETYFSYGSSEKRGTVTLDADVPVEVRIEFSRTDKHPIFGLRVGVAAPEPADLMERAVAAARAADACVLVLGSNPDWETEGSDRADLKLPGDQDALAAAVLAANPNTIVVLNIGAPVTMPWLDQAGAVLCSWFAGQEFGNALADVLFGAADPGGRLPFSWPERLESTAAFAHYPGQNLQMPYTEGLAIGYRWHAATGNAPLFPFGHGLTYASSSLSGPAVTDGPEGPRLRLTVTNHSGHPGTCVPQIYAEPLDRRDLRDLVQLCGFTKVRLAPHERRELDIALDPRAFTFWDEAANGFAPIPGRHRLRIGTSAAELPLEIEIAPFKSQ